MSLRPPRQLFEEDTVFLRVIPRRTTTATMSLRPQQLFEEDTVLLRVVPRIPRRTTTATMSLPPQQLFEEDTEYLSLVPRIQPRTTTATIATTDGHFILSDDDNNNGRGNNHNRVSVSETRNLGIVSVSTQQQQRHSLEKIKVEEGLTLECSICLTELSVGVEVIRLPKPCSHMYHEHCIMRWLTTSDTCPLCRRKVL